MAETKPVVVPTPAASAASKTDKNTKALVVAAAGAALLAILLKSSNTGSGDAYSDAPPDPSGPPPGVPPQLWGIAVRVSQQVGVPLSILGGLVSAESSWRVPNEPGNASKCGVPCANSSCAAGLTQMKRGAVEDVGGYWSGICDPENAIRWGALYLKRLYNKYGNWNAAVQAYNTGGGAFDNGSRNPAYLSSVMRAANRYSVSGLGGLRLFRVRA